MAVAERWTIPFISTKGVKYEVDIYDTYTGTKPSTWPVTLQAGATPFVTTEDSSDDFFSPVRGSTGTLTVIDTDGTLFEQIVPATNTSRKVVLYKVTWDEQGEEWEYTIQWQGFLSCEAYSQDYTATAQELSLSVNSVLEAMDSVKIPSSLTGLLRVKRIVGLILQQMNNLGISFGSIYYPYTSRQVMLKYMDTAALYTIAEYINEGTTARDAEGISCKELITRLCTFMGWCCRESLNNVYFEHIGQTDKYTYESYSYFITYPNTIGSNLSYTSTSAMSALTYRGTSHQKSITQGARSVEVAASLTNYDSEIDIPKEFPTGSFLNSTRSIVLNEDSEGTQTLGTAYGSENTNFNTSYNFQTLIMYEGSTGATVVEVGGTIEDVFNDNIFIKSGTWGDNYLGAMMLTAQNSTDDQYDFTGVYVACTTRSAYYSLFRVLGKHILKYNSIIPLNVASGTLHIDWDAVILQTDANDNIYQTEIEEGYKLYAAIKWGSVYLTASKQWTSTFTIIQLEKAADPIQVPITGIRSGVLEVQLYALPIEYTVAGGTAKYYQYVLKELSVEYVPAKIIPDNQTTNHYRKLIDIAFKDEISIACDIATNRSNEASPSHLFNSVTLKTTTIPYTKTDGTTENRRPEHDLLNRMVSYYGAARRKVELEVEHPSIGLQTTTITGYDGKSYAPLAEERDWQTDTSKLTCFETI